MSTIDMSKETTARSAMKLALEALEYIANETYDPWTKGAEAGRIAQTTLSKIKNKCRAIQTSDQMTCECGNVWDMNDPYPPKCTALREALASEAIEQPAPVAKPHEQEPVAVPDCGEAGHDDGACGNRECLPSFRRSITSPPTLSLAQRQARSADTWVNTTTWRGLTDEEILIMSRYDLEYAALIGEVQRKLKEKNSD